MTDDVLVVGVGNRFRGDDAVGLVVIDRLRAIAPQGVRALECDGDAGRLMDAWQGSSRVIVVDAMMSNGSPGDVREFDVASVPLPYGFGMTSTHAFGLREAVELARTLGELPHEIVVVGIEAAGFDLGSSLTPDVRSAVDTAVGRVVSRCHAPSGGTGEGPGR